MVRFVLILGFIFALVACSEVVAPTNEVEVSAPTNVTLGALNNGALQLAWQHLGNADGFVIYREETALNSVNVQAFSELAEVAKDVRQFDDDSVKQGFSYRYQVTAIYPETASEASQVTESLSPKEESTETPEDTESPSVSLVSSSESVTAAGTIRLTATATDNVGVTKVVFYRNNVVLSEDDTAPYEATVALDEADNGSQVFFAKAIDAAANESSSESLSVTVAIAPVQPLMCSGSATYMFTFNSSWSAATHPSNFPANPHYSGFIGANHSDAVSLWQVGSLASAGVKQVAETGSKSELIPEIQAAIANQAAETQISEGGVATSPDAISFMFEVSSDYSKVSLISMLAPSPDWFVGVSSLELCENGEWLTELNRDAFVYDAGTDSGPSYTSSNEATVPAELVTRLDEAPFLVNGSVVPVGRFSFVKQ